MKTTYEYFMWEKSNNMYFRTWRTHTICLILFFFKILSSVLPLSRIIIIILHVSIPAFEKRLYKSSEKNLDQSLNLFFNLLRVSYVAILEKLPSFREVAQFLQFTVILYYFPDKPEKNSFIQIYFIYEICSAYFEYSIVVLIIVILVLITEEGCMKIRIYTTRNHRIIGSSKEQVHKTFLQ